MPDEESPIPPSMRNYKDMVVTIEEENDDLSPGYYLSTLTPKGVWEQTKFRDPKGSRIIFQCVNISRRHQER